MVISTSWWICWKQGITDLKGQVVAISGSGNVATYTAEKVLELGGKMEEEDEDGEQQQNET